LNLRPSGYETGKRQASRTVVQAPAFETMGVHLIFGSPASIAGCACDFPRFASGVASSNRTRRSETCSSNERICLPAQGTGSLLWECSSRLPHAPATMVTRRGDYAGGGRSWRPGRAYWRSRRGRRRRGGGTTYPKKGSSKATNGKPGRLRREADGAVWSFRRGKI